MKSIVTDLKAVILCGPGHRLYPLVDSHTTPKCMLPLGNQPMLYYPLTWLLSAGILDITIIAMAGEEGSKIQTFLDRLPWGGWDTRCRPKLRLVEELSGTMDTLLMIREGMEAECAWNNLMILPCDFITNMAIEGILCRMRTCVDVAMFAVLAGGGESADRIGMGAAKATQKSPATNKNAAAPTTSNEPAHRQDTESLFIALNAEEATTSTDNNNSNGNGNSNPNASFTNYGIDESPKQRILWWHSREDTIDEGNMIVMPMAILSRYGCVDVRSGGLLDMHCYVFTVEFLKGLAGSMHCRLQDGSFAAASDVDARPDAETDSSHSFNDDDHPLADARKKEASATIQPPKYTSPHYSIKQDLVPSVVSRQFGRQDYYRCEAILVGDGDFAMRANCLSVWASASKQIGRLYDPSGSGASDGGDHSHILSTGKPRISQAALIDPTAQLGLDCLVGDHTKISPKTTIKRTIIGDHVRIGRGCRISNTCIVDYAVIGDGCRIEGSCIGWGARIDGRVYLKDCDVGCEFRVENGGEGEFEGEEGEFEGEEATNEHREPSTPEAAPTNDTKKTRNKKSILQIKAQILAEGRGLMFVEGG